MVVVAISVGMMAALGFLIYNFNKTSSYEQTSVESSGSATAVMRDIESLVLPADAVLGAHTFANGTYTSTSTSLVLEIPSIDSSGNIIAGAHDYAAFYIVGTTSVYRLLQPNASSARASSTKQLSSTVSSLTFSYNNADFTKVSSTTVDIQTQARVKQDVLTDHQHEQIRLRNR
ncbi:hypothetical protein KGQ72_02925 [Patescibacteria group bacterium]|nr:hypothetical protein [Patescibacteria group bacterium]